MIAVVIRSLSPDRIAQALRAAVGLTLRGEAVAVVVDKLPPDERVHKAVATLRALGHQVGAPISVLREARAVEVWS
jgi:hypothetical protein